MPIHETVNAGREFLDQFGLEAEGWRPLHGEEIHNDGNLPSLPDELLIPAIGKPQLDILGLHLKPAKPERIAGMPWVYLQAMPEDIDPTEVAYTWVRPQENTPPVGVMAGASTMNTLHTWAFYGSFKPTIAETLGRLCNSSRFVVNPDKPEYYWTEAYGGGDPQQGLWPNVPVEVKADGKQYFLENGAYHLGRTTLYQLMPDDEMTRNILEDREEALA